MIMLEAHGICPQKDIYNGAFWWDLEYILKEFSARNS